MPNRDLSHLREAYLLGTLEIEHCHDDPFVQFDIWFQQATEANVFEPNAMSLATVSSSGQPSARTVLLKSFNHEGFVFYTNYESKKGREMAENERVCLLFWWREQHRQVRIEGRVSKTGREAAEKYFHSRPTGSQLAASISPQSKVVANRESLETQMIHLASKYPSGKIPLPENWGGYNVKPVLFEFWQGRDNRLHDRIEYVLENDLWVKRRLAP